MNTTRTGRAEGVRRISVVISGIGWFWLIAFFIGMIAAAHNGRGDGVTATILIIFGVVGFVIAKAISWIVAGFA